MALKKASTHANCLTIPERSSIVVRERSGPNTTGVKGGVRDLQRSRSNLFMHTLRRLSIQMRSRHPNNRRFKSTDGTLLRSNERCAQRAWGKLSRRLLGRLAELTHAYRLSVTAGHLQLLNGRWYITHAGLLSVAERRRCAEIRTSVERHLSDPEIKCWVLKAIVNKSGGSRGFGGYGDADPSNTSPLVRGAEMRVAETRAVNRALRKAYGIGL